MSTKLPAGVSEFTARSIINKQIKSWCDVGEKSKQELKSILKKIGQALIKNNSPFKTINLAKRNLLKFLENENIRGQLTEINNRHLTFNLSFIEAVDSVVYYSVISSEINARTRAATLDASHLYKISIHAIQRLLERSSERTDIAALDEIYSSIDFAKKWNLAAKNTSAIYWPILSRNGFFICAFSDIDEANAITWINENTLSKKWMPVISTIRNLTLESNNVVFDIEFIQEFIRTFPWMLHEHSSSKDSLTIAWEQKEIENPEEERSLVTNSAGIKESITYQPGLNYQAAPPNLKSHSKLSGIVTYIKPDKAIIIGLKNGWVGIVPKVAIDRSKKIIRDYTIPKIGDHVNVYIRKITKLENEDAYFIFVNLEDLYKADWKLTEESYPIDKTISGKIFSALNHEYGIQLADGTRGLVDKNKVNFLIQKKYYGQDINQINLDMIVVGHDEEKRNLLLDINIDNETIDISKAQIGEKISGMVIRKTDNYSVLLLSNGLNGILHRFNSYCPLPSAGEEITCTIIDINYQNQSLVIARSKNNGKNFYALPLTHERWTAFESENKVGDVLQVQAKAWLSDGSRLLVANKYGITGLISKNEIIWISDTSTSTSNIEIDDIFDAKIVKINSIKHKIEFSIRQLIPNPLLEINMDDMLNKQLEGIVTTVRDYGYFVYIPSLKCTGLLHVSKLHDIKQIFKKNDPITVFIEHLDLEKNRVSLKL